MSDPDRGIRTPSWVASAHLGGLEELAFQSGASLATLHLALAAQQVPVALLRDRLALRAASACVGFMGRAERESALRDEVHLARSGDQLGPAGAVYSLWRDAVARPLSVPHLRKILPGAMVDHIAGWLRPKRTGPVRQAASVLHAVLADFPRDEAAALILADAVLARALGWDHLVPLLAAGLSRRDLRKTGDDLAMACHRAVTSSGGETVKVASDLTRRAVRLRSVVPKLRAKEAGAAVALFLSRDALSPSVGLAPVMPDRAARRLCDRLVALGVMRELTGRTSFRLYGL